MTTGRYTVPTCMNLPGLFSSALKRICFLGRWICEDDRVSQLLSHFADQLVPPGAGSEGRGGIQRSEDDFKLGSSLVPFLKVGWSSRQYKEFRPRHIWFYRFIFYTSHRCCPSIFLTFHTFALKIARFQISCPCCFVMVNSFGIPRSGALGETNELSLEAIGSDSIGLIRIGMAILVGSVTGGTSTLDV